MNNNKKKSGFFNTTSLGAAALTLSFAAQVFAPVNAAIAADPQPAPAIGQEERPQDVLTKFVQHAMSGRIGMMELEEKMAVPMSMWVKYLHAIAGQGEYAEIPPKIEARIPEKEYYKGRGGEAPVMDVLIQTGQFASVREQVRNSVTADYLTKEETNGYMLLADLLAKGQWNALSEETRAEISKDLDLWMSPIAIVPSGNGEVMHPPVTIAAIHNRLDIVPDDILKSMATHLLWSENKRLFLSAAVETRQMTDFLKRLGADATAFWRSFTDNDLTVRDESGANLIYRFTEMGQAHLLPEKFWQSVGIAAFTTVNSQTKMTPLYLIASTKEAAKHLTPGQLAVLHQASLEDWMFEETRLQNAENEKLKKNAPGDKAKYAGVTAFFNAMYHMQSELVGDKAWSDLKHDDVVSVRSDGNSLAYWIGNAGAVDRIAHLLRDDEKASLPTRGSIAATRTDWTDVMTLRNEIDHGRIDKAKLKEVSPSGRTRLSDLLRSIPPAETVEKILPRFTFDELTKIEGTHGEFPLMIIADTGFLKYVSSDVWFKIRTNPDVLTRKANDGRFILDIAARDINNKQLSVIPRNVLASLPSAAYFMRNDRGGFPFIDAHVTMQDDALPFESGKFRPHHLMIRAPSKGDSLTHMHLRDEKIKKKRQEEENKRVEELKKQGLLNAEAEPAILNFEPEHMKKVLARFPFETWRYPDEAGETAILHLARNGEFRHLPKEEFQQRVTSADLETKGRYKDTPLYWIASDMYSEMVGSAVVWRFTLDLLRPSALAGVKPEVWLEHVRSAPEDDLALTEQTRYTLAREDFALLGAIKIGSLPPSSYRWTKKSFTEKDGTGNTVARELDRQGKLNVDRLHDFARLGLLDKEEIPPYVMVKFSAADWLYKPAGALRSTFEEAVNHGQVAAAEWGNTGVPKLQSIPAELWYARGVDGSAPVSKLIRQGAMRQIPADYLYERPQFWTESLLTEVYDGGVWMGKPQEMKDLWESQVGYIEMAIRGSQNPEKTQILKGKKELYQSFAPRFEENYKLAGGTVAPVSVPVPGPALQ